MTEVVVGPAEPFAVPAGFPYGRFHVARKFKVIIGGKLKDERSSSFVFQLSGNTCHLLACQDKQSCNKHALSHFAFLVGRGLEGLTGRIGEAVEIQTVVPIGAADEGQMIGTEAIERILNGTLQMLVKGSLCPWLIFVLNQFIQNRPVSAFFDVR